MRFPEFSNAQNEHLHPPSAGGHDFASSLAVIVSAVVADQVLAPTRGGSDNAARDIVTNLINDYCAAAPKPAGARTAYLLGAALHLNAIATSFADGNAVGAELRKVAASISARAFAAPAPELGPLAVPAGFYRRFFAELGKEATSRADMANGLIDLLHARTLVTKEEADDLRGLIEVVRTGDGNDITLAKKVLERTERARHRGAGSIAGAIMESAGRTARAVFTANGNGASDGQSVRHGPLEARPGGGGNGDTLPGTGVPATPGTVAGDAVYFGVVGAILGGIVGGPLGALAGWSLGAIAGGIVGGFENGIFDAGGGGGDGCFTGTTPVLMADGSKKNIEAVTVGDLVMARDETTGATGAYPVTRTFRHAVDKTLLLRLQGGEIIETTAAHRFATAEGAFVGAGRLQPGNKLSTKSDRGAVLRDAETLAGEVSVYNLAVDQFHTYFVGESELWVHNRKDTESPD